MEPQVSGLASSLAEQKRASWGQDIGRQTRESGIARTRVPTVNSTFEPYRTLGHFIIGPTYPHPLGGGSARMAKADGGRN